MHITAQAHQTNFLEIKLFLSIKLNFSEVLMYVKWITFALKRQYHEGANSYEIVEYKCHIDRIYGSTQAMVRLALQRYFTDMC